ncbi:hypothetical protein NQ318_018519 [Aromia moschata]|uniref:Uncharacterized protein n=1 Tax=Aromia moschata TaxID=1265417 RepID=A0AAV8ZGJ9_9CUCU|nr:hypothetical protein NQ318_018519 [Aromia moschata]
MGSVAPDDDMSKSPKSNIAVQNNLLNDEGSAGYKDWLSKSTTLEDIYRHYNQPQNRFDEFIEEDEKEEEFDEEYNGHMPGYAIPSHGHSIDTPAKHRGHTGLGMYYGGGKYQGGVYPYPSAVYHSGGNSGYPHGGGSSGYHGGGYHTGGSSGYSHGGGSIHHDEGGGYTYQDHESEAGAGHSAYGGLHAIHEHEHVYHTYPPKYQGHHEEGYNSKEHDLVDLFDIALTALAFLSFGMFIVHVIMCISAAHQDATTTAASMMMPMSMGPTSTGTGGMLPTSTGNGGGDGSMTATGGGGTATGGGTTGAGEGTPTGGGGTSTGSGATPTDSDNGGAGGDGGDGGDDSMGTATGGGTTGDGSTGGGTGDGDTGGGDGENMGGSTGAASPGTATGTGDGDTTTGGGTTSTGTGDGGDGADGDSTGTGAGRDTLNFRWKRDIPTITNPNNQALNELARRVLVSIEAALIANNDGGVCLRKSLCENNKFSRTLEGKDKIIIPMWSLGMSWLSGRLVKNISSATSMLDTLKASVLGLGRADCEIIYQECDLRREVIERRRRRRRRSTG